MKIAPTRDGYYDFPLPPSLKTLGPRRVFRTVAYADTVDDHPRRT